MNKAKPSSPPLAAPQTHTNERNTRLTRNCNICAALLGWRLRAAPPSKKMDLQKVHLSCAPFRGRTPDLREGSYGFSQLGHHRLALAFWNGERKTGSFFCLSGHPRD